MLISLKSTVTAISASGFGSVASQLRFTGPVVTSVVDTAAVVGLVGGLLVVAVVAPGTSPWMVSSRMLQDVWQTTWQG